MPPLRLCSQWLGIAMLAGCAAAPQVAVTSKTLLPSPVMSAQTESLSPADLARISSPDVESAYVLGPDDQISISVYLHPELSVPVSSGIAGNGALITSDGTISLPLIGNTKLGGLTIQEAEDLLTSRYAGYVDNPEVNIELVAAQSLRYYLLGAFVTPGVKYPLHPLNLLEALALGGSVEIPSADLYQAYVARGATKLPVDLNALLVQGDLSQNIALASGDVIVIPSSTNENAFVFGAVTKPGAVPFNSGSLSLLQALSGASLDLASLTNAELSQIRIIRAGGRSAEFFVVNAQMILNGDAQPFDLRPGDIVFVPPSPVATWNEAINLLLPSITAIGDILNPFVSIKYLKQ